MLGRWDGERRKEDKRFTLPCGSALGAVDSATTVARFMSKTFRDSGRQHAADLFLGRDRCAIAPKLQPGMWRCSLLRPLRGDKVSHNGCKLMLLLQWETHVMVCDRVCVCVCVCV